MLQVGGRNISGPLIWPTLRRAFAFLVLLVVLTIIEEVVVGLFHHQSIAASLGELFGARLQETLAGYLIMLLVLIPFFAFRVLSEALGEGFGLIPDPPAQYERTVHREWSLHSGSATGRLCRSASAAYCS